MKFEINMGLANVLTIAFVVLKLCHIINWSWWFVVSPSIIFLFIPFFIIGLIFSTLSIIEFFEAFYFKKKKK
jgi:hypothetical protein